MFSYKGLAGGVVVETVLPWWIVQLPALNCPPVLPVYTTCLVCLMNDFGYELLRFVVMKSHPWAPTQFQTSNACNSITLSRRMSHRIARVAIRTWPVSALSLLPLPYFKVWRTLNSSAFLYFHIDAESLLPVAIAIEVEVLLWWYSMCNRRYTQKVITATYKSLLPMAEVLRIFRPPHEGPRPHHRHGASVEIEGRLTGLKKHRKGSFRFDDCNARNQCRPVHTA